MELAKTKRISIICNSKCAKKEVPESFKLTKGDLFSSKILMHDNTTLTSYQRKKNINVLLLSTLHPILEIDDNEKKMPEVVHFYNSTKYDMDMLDQMARKYSTKSTCHRWLVQGFFRNLDLAVMNTWIIYKETTSINIKHCDFIQKMNQLC